ncbi:unnamed protein product, partial [Staurois parvus]
CPLQRPRPSPSADAIFCVLSPSSGRTGAAAAAGGGKFKNFKNVIFFFFTFYIVKHYCIKPFHIHFVPSALSCALSAFLLFFLPGN